MPGEQDNLLKSIVVPNPALDVRQLPLDAREGFVLSRIDGTCTVQTLGMLVGMDDAAIAGIVQKLLDLGAVMPKGGAPRPKPMQPVVSGQSVAPPAARAPEVALPRSQRPVERNDLSDAEQQRIWELHEAMPQMTHFDLLGVPRSVDAAALKVAYYKFSKEFHPDRYFGKQLGAYKHLLEQLFRTGKLAYETLNDPAQRAAYEKKTPAAAPVVAGASAGERQKQSELEAHRQRIMEERAKKRGIPFQEQIDRAKQHAQDADALMKSGDVVAAAAKIALALAFDPQNAQYQRLQAQVAPLALDKRIKALVAQAETEANTGAFAAAARRYVEAFDLQPTSGTFAHRASELLFKQGSDLPEALRLAELAAQKSPRNPDVRLNLALIYEKTGNSRAAKQALDEAMDLGCDDPEAKKLSKRLR